MILEIGSVSMYRYIIVLIIIFIYRNAQLKHWCLNDSMYLQCISLINLFGVVLSLSNYSEIKSIMTLS